MRVGFTALSYIGVADEDIEPPTDVEVTAGIELVRGQYVASAEDIRRRARSRWRVVTKKALRH